MSTIPYPSYRLWSTLVFRGVVFAFLVGYVLFILGLLLSLASHTNSAQFATSLVSPETLFSVRLSLITATLSAGASLVIAIPAAYALSRAHFWGKSIVETLLDLPLVMPPIALGMALLVFFRTPVGQGIEATGVRFVFTPLGIVLAQFTLVSTFALRMMKASFDSIDPRYEKVAQTLGCHQGAIFWRVTLPLARRGILAAAVLTWARAVGDFGATVILAGATAFKTETLPIAIFLNLSTIHIERAIAVTLILVGLSLVALLGFRWVGGRGL
ncbi:MAG: ABC transporter permease [Chloroflexi bacterium]|nr:ABC transporter permease [Chloroflexota bacterium]